MIKDKTILAIITARSGSKSVKNKNLKFLGAKPLIFYTIDSARNSRYLDRIIISTDSQEIADICMKYNEVDVPFLRPKKFATNESPSHEAIAHAIKWLKVNENKNYDYVCLLQPTSPFRTTKDIDKAILKFIKTIHAESLVAICRSRYNPFWIKIINKDNYLSSLVQQKKQINRRQDAPDTFEINGAFYITESERYLKNKTFFCEKTAYYLMDEISSLDIDEELDFFLAETIIRKSYLPMDKLKEL